MSKFKAKMGKFRAQIDKFGVKIGKFMLTASQSLPVDGWTEFIIQTRKRLNESRMLAKRKRRLGSNWKKLFAF